MTKSKFLKVKSPDSDYTVVIFDKCDTVVKDPVTGSTIALPTGGKAKILGEILEELECVLRTYLKTVITLLGVLLK